MTTRWLGVMYLCHGSWADQKHSETLELLKHCLSSRHCFLVRNVKERVVKAVDVFISLMPWSSGIRCNAMLSPQVKQVQLPIVHQYPPALTCPRSAEFFGLRSHRGWHSKVQGEILGPGNPKMPNQSHPTIEQKPFSTLEQ